MSTYSVDDKQGNEIAAGLSEERARARAQEWANENDAPASVYLVSLRSEDEPAEEHAERTRPVVFYPAPKRAQVSALLQEAGAAADAKQISICRRAMRGDAEALRDVARTLFLARG